jgi:hypothetical protein
MNKRLFKGISSAIYPTTIDSHYELFYDIVNRSEVEVAKVEALTDVYTNFRLTFNHEALAYRKHQLIESDDMLDIDRWRMGLVGGIFYMIRMRKKSLDPADRSAAKLLYKEIVLTYPETYRHGLEEKSGRINNILEDFNKPKYQAAITKLNLLSLINELISANNAFDQKFYAKTDEEEAMADVGSPSKAHAATNKAFSAFLGAIEHLYNANEMTTKDEDLRDNLSAIAFIINGLLHQVEKSLAHKRPKKKNNKTDETGSNPEHKSNKSTETTDNNDDIKDKNTDTNEENIDKKDESTETDDEKEHS